MAPLLCFCRNQALGDWQAREELDGGTSSTGCTGTASLTAQDARQEVRHLCGKEEEGLEELAGGPALELPPS